VQKHPFITDFVLLELLDAVWINEIYKPHSRYIVEIAKKEIDAIHTLERFEELAEKKEILRKIINVVHQMDFNLSSNNILLSLSSGKS